MLLQGAVGLTALPASTLRPARHSSCLPCLPAPAKLRGLGQPPTSRSARSLSRYSLALAASPSP